MFDVSSTLEDPPSVTSESFFAVFGALRGLRLRVVFFFGDCVSASSVSSPSGSVDKASAT